MHDSVLFISPSAVDAKTLSQMLGSIAIRCEHVETLKRARRKLEAEAFGVVLTEARLPDGTWADVVRLVGQAERGSAVVVTDNLGDARLWLDSLDLGAYDVLAKPFCGGEVQRILANALHEPPRFPQPLLRLRRGPDQRV
jgi:DNA-binding NtrC family response regulator